MIDTATQTAADRLADQIKDLDFDAAWNILNGHAEQAPMVDAWDGPFYVQNFYVSTDRNTIVFNDGSLLTCHEDTPSLPAAVRLEVYPSLLHAERAGLIKVEDALDGHAREVNEILSRLSKQEIELLRKHFQEGR